MFSEGHQSSPGIHFVPLGIETNAVIGDVLGEVTDLYYLRQDWPVHHRQRRRDYVTLCNCDRDRCRDKGRGNCGDGRCYVRLVFGEALLLQGGCRAGR